MTVLIGNNYLVWVAAPGGSPTYAVFGGQQNGSLGATRETADASHKTSGGVALSVPGLRSYPITLSFVADLPDAGGYSVVESAYKSASGSVLLQVRKGGAAGASPADVIFACEMYVTQLTVDLSLNGVVSGTVTFVPKAAPTTDLTLA